MRLPLLRAAGGVVRAGRKAGRVLGARGVSDHWKEKAMGAYARQSFVSTGLLALLLGLILGLAALLVLGFGLIAPGFAGFLLGWQGLLFSLLCASAWAWARQAMRGGAGKTAYGPADRLLHRVALAPPVAELSFDLDQKKVTRDPDEVGQGAHVFVAGLARAGTTALMRAFHDSGAFTSLTYRDMPFVLAPNLWRRLSGVSRRELDAAERAHGDGVVVDADSPESLDEVFWRVFDRDGYIRRDHLAPHRPGADLTGAFRRYVAAILQAREGTRYLAKNNNNILRLAAVAEAFPNASILIPFRDPEAQADSLLRQHRRFRAEGRADRFVTAYMRWLAHHEFGPDHRPFRFDGDSATSPSAYDPDTLDYWLELWCRTYAWLDETAPAGAVFVCYEDLCRDPDVWRALAAQAGIAPGAGTFRESASGASAAADPELAASARQLYAKLAARARSGLAAA